MALASSGHDGREGHIDIKFKVNQQERKRGSSARHVITPDQSDLLGINT